MELTQTTLGATEISEVKSKRTLLIKASPHVKWGFVMKRVAIGASVALLTLAGVLMLTGHH